MQRSESSVMVSWTVPDNNGLRITFFRIQYKDVRGTGRWQTIEHDILSAVREYEVTGLEPGEWTCYNNCCMMYINVL